MVKFKLFSNKGRRPENQDNAVAILPGNGTPHAGLFAVMDGLGGHSAGREAALEAGRRIEKAHADADFFCDYGAQPNSPTRLETLFRSINRYLFETGKRNPNFRRWGCSASILHIHDGVWEFAHTGDTRIYLFQQNSVKLLTEVQNIAWMAFQYDQISYEEYRNSPDRSKLLSYLGIGDEMAFRSGSGKIEAGDVFCVCTDGINQFADLRDMETLPAAAASKPGDLSLMENMYDILIRDIVRVNEAEDNITFMLIST